MSMLQEVVMPYASNHGKKLIYIAGKLVHAENS